MNIVVKNNIFNTELIGGNRYEKCLNIALYDSLVSLQRYAEGYKDILYYHLFRELDIRLKLDKSSIRKYMIEMISNQSFRLILKDYFIFHIMKDTISKNKDIESVLNKKHFYIIKVKIESILKDKYSKLINNVLIYIDKKGNITITASIMDYLVSLETPELSEKYNSILYNLFCTRSRLETNNTEDSIPILLFVLEEFNSIEKAKSDIEKIKKIKNTLIDIGDYVIKNIQKTTGDREVLRVYPMLKFSLSDSEILFILKYSNMYTKKLIKYILIKGEELYEIKNGDRI